MAARILMLEDSDFDFKLVQLGISSSYELLRADSLNLGYRYLQDYKFDLIILDLELGDGSGYELCTYLRSKEEYASVPIMILSGKSSSVDKVMGFQLGADDYLIKPVDVNELKARIDRKMSQKNQAVGLDLKIARGPLKLFFETSKLVLVTSEGDEPVDLTPTEFRILWMLAKHPGRIYSREQISDYCYGYETSVSQRTIDSHVRSLRKKLGEHAGFLDTVYGVGYRLLEAKPAAA